MRQAAGRPVRRRGVDLDQVDLPDPVEQQLQQLKQRLDALEAQLREKSKD
jgi:transposase